VGRFASTASYYVRFRPHYPPALIEQLVEAASLDRGSRVLDLGAGPGHVAIPLAAHVAEVVAVDPEPDMLARIDAPNVRTVLGCAEDVDEGWGAFALATAGRSFHWFDQQVVLETLPRVTRQLALLGDSITQSESQNLVLEIAAELTGEERAPAHTRTWRRYADLLARSPFSDVVELEVEVDRTWTADSLIGLAYSTSVASPERLGDLAGAFERRVHERFGDGEVSERVAVGAVLGRRRDE
jgi:SAM-dependent methyltransferase